MQTSEFSPFSTNHFNCLATHTFWRLSAGSNSAQVRARIPVIWIWKERSDDPILVCPFTWTRVNKGRGLLAILSWFKGMLLQPLFSVSKCWKRANLHDTHAKILRRIAMLWSGETKVIESDTLFPAEPSLSTVSVIILSPRWFYPVTPFFPIKTCHLPKSFKFHFISFSFPGSLKIQHTNPNVPTTWCTELLRPSRVQFPKLARVSHQISKQLVQQWLRSWSSEFC